MADVVWAVRHGERQDTVDPNWAEHAEHVRGTLLLVGHGLTIGGVVQGLIGSADGADAPLCGLTRLERDGDGWQLDFSGDTSHLDA